MSAGLSACIVARDAEATLARCLDGLAFVDEIVVLIDERSRDGSLALARARADRVEVRPYAGNVAQKRDCVALARHDWVLVVDADEVVRPALAGELRQALAGAGERVGFELCRRTWHLGRWLRHGDFYPDWKLRLFRRSRARWIGRDPHGRVIVDGPVARLGTDLDHYSYRDLSDQVERIQEFSREGARALHASGRRARPRDLWLRPPARFLRAYLARGGFRDGVPGLVVAGATAFYVFLKYAKLWELERVAAGTGATLEGSSPKRLR